MATPVTHAHGWRFCPSCGAPWHAGAPVCERCAFTHHPNPPLGVVALVVDGDRVLLGLRGEGVEAPGRWSLPGGFVDPGEHPEEALAREVSEETGLIVVEATVASVGLNRANPRKPVVTITYHTTASGTPRPGDDFVEVRWFEVSSPPPLAFEDDLVRLVQSSSGGTSQPGPGGS